MARASSLCVVGSSFAPASFGAMLDPGNHAVGSVTRWDMSWTTRLVAKHRAVFDSPEIAYGDAIDQVTTVIEGYREAFDIDRAINCVLVMRASGVRLAFNDALWRKYALNAELKLPGTGNPYAEPLASLAKGGVILLACNKAAMFYAQIMATRAGTDVESTRREIRENLVPGATLMPSGVFAVVHAQEVGCHLVKST